MKMPFKSFVCSTFLALLMLSMQVYATKKSNFEKYDLDFGVSVELPSDWTIISLDLGHKSKLPLRKHPKEAKKTLIAANAAPVPTGAMLRINAINRPTSRTNDLSFVSKDDLNEAGKMVLDGLKAMEKKGGPKIVEMKSASIEPFNDCQALLISYIRMGYNAPVKWLVRQYKIPKDGYVIEVTLSYRHSDETTWIPLLNYIKQSIKITSFSP